MFQKLVAELNNSVFTINEYLNKIFVEGIEIENDKFTLNLLDGKHIITTTNELVVYNSNFDKIEYKDDFKDLDSFLNSKNKVQKFIQYCYKNGLHETFGRSVPYVYITFLRTAVGMESDLEKIERIALKYKSKSVVKIMEHYDSNKGVLKSDEYNIKKFTPQKKGYDSVIIVQLKDGNMVTLAKNGVYNGQALKEKVENLDMFTEKDKEFINEKYPLI